MAFSMGLLGASAPAPAATFQLLESTVLTGSQASVEFTNLTTKYAATYQHLQIRALARTTRTVSNDILGLRFNGDTGGNYSWHVLNGNGSSVASEGGANTSYIVTFAATGNTATTESFGATVWDILDPFETTKNKTTRTLYGRQHSGDSNIALSSGNWRNTASTTSLTLFSGTGNNLAQFSRFSLYGIRGS